MATPVLPQPDQQQEPQYPKPTLEDISLAEQTLKRLLDFRRPLDARRLHWFRQYIGQREQQMFPDGITKRSNTFVMYPFANVEQIVNRTTDAYFGFDPWFECNGWTETDDEVSEKMGIVMHHKLRHSKIVPAIEEFARTCATYGDAGLKIDWDWDYDEVVYPSPVYAQALQPVAGPDGNPMMGPDGHPVMQPQPVVNPMTGQPVILRVERKTKRVPRMLPKFIPIDIYDLLVDPDNHIKAHLTERTFGQLQREQETYLQIMGQPLYFPEALAELQKAVAQEKEPGMITIRIAELWNEDDGSCQVLVYGKDPEALYWKDTRSAFRYGVTRPFRRKVYGGKTIMLWKGLNPFAHKKVPIVHCAYVKLPSEPFGVGAIECISGMVDSLSNFVNMVTDNWNLGINRRYAYNVEADIDTESLKNFNTPGGQVAVVGDPNNVIKPLEFFTPNPNDYMILDVYKGMIEVASGMSDFYSKGVGGTGGNRTATGISQIIGESNYRFKGFIRNLEILVLQPLLEMVASMIQQFCTDQMEVEITDAPPGIPKYLQVAPEDLIGNFHFNLVAANYATNKVVRQRNLMALVQIVGESPYWNQYEGLKEIAKVFEIRNINKLLKTPDQVAQEQAQAEQKQIQMMIFESMLQTESAARIAQARPNAGAGQGKGGGRPPRAQFEGKIPGAGLTSAIKGMAQSMGANALGLEGLGEISGAE